MSSPEITESELQVRWLLNKAWVSDLSEFGESRAGGAVHKTIQELIIAGHGRSVLAVANEDSYRYVNGEIF